MGMSGSEAAAGACPATAWRTPTRPVATNRTAIITLRRMSPLPYQVRSITGFRIVAWCGRDLIRRWYGRRQGLAQRQPHCGDLLQLSDDDSLSHTPEWLIASVTHSACAISMAP